MNRHVLHAVIAGLMSLALSSPALAQSLRYDELANLPFNGPAGHEPTARLTSISARARQARGRTG